MKKILLALTAVLASMGTTVGQNSLKVADFTLPQNSDALLTVSYQFDVADTYTGYSFNLELPDDLEFVMAEGTDVAVTKGTCHDASHSVTANLDGGLVKVAGLSLSSKPLTGTSGALLTFTVRPKSEVSVGQTFVGTIKDIIIVPVEGTKQNLAASSFTVTIGEPADLRVVLDEAATTLPEAAAGVDVRVKRTINAGEWSTICLPFAMTAEQVKAAFGNDVQLADFSSWNSEEDDEGAIVAINVGFTDVTEMDANHPYIIKVSAKVTEFTVDGVDIDPEEEPVVQVGKRAAERGWMYGTYVKTTIPEENVFLSGNKFWYSVGKTQTKGLRGYFEFRDLLDAYYDEASATSRIVMFFEDETTTGVTENVNSKLSNSKYYDLQGRRVVKPGKGLYIKNGKKEVIK